MYEFALEYPAHPSIPAPELRWAGPHTSLQEAQRSAQAEAGPLSWSEDGLHGTGEQCQVTIRPAFQMDEKVDILTPSYDGATGYVKSILHGAVGVWIPAMHCDEDSVTYFTPTELRPSDLSRGQAPSNTARCDCCLIPLPAGQTRCKTCHDNGVTPAVYDNWAESCDQARSDPPDDPAPQ